MLRQVLALAHNVERTVGGEDIEIRRARGSSAAIVDDVLWHLDLEILQIIIEHPRNLALPLDVRAVDIASGRTIARAPGADNAATFLSCIRKQLPVEWQKQFALYDQQARDVLRRHILSSIQARIEGALRDMKLLPELNS